MTALEDIQLKRQQAASLVKERRDREELARTVINGITDKGIRVMAELDISKISDEQLKSLEQLRSVISQLQNSEKTESSELKTLVQDLITAVKALEVAPRIDVPAPVVNIPAQAAPQVTVDVDLDRLEMVLRELLTPTAPKIDLSNYRAQDIKDSGDDLQYVGFVNPEGHWYIIENDVKKNQMRYLFGTRGYSKHFKNAGQYEYKILDKAIHAQT